MAYRVNRRQVVGWFIVLLALSFFLGMLMGQAWARALGLQVGWDPVTQYEDGAPAEIEHYTLYVCDAPVSDTGECDRAVRVVDVPGLDDTAEITYESTLAAGLLYVRASSTAEGVQSALSNQLSVAFSNRVPKTMTIRLVFPEN